MMNWINFFVFASIAVFTCIEHQHMPDELKFKSGLVVGAFLVLTALNAIYVLNG